MTVTSVEKDPATLSMVVTAEFDAPVEKVWQLWADPRKLERWWGPPTYPATFVDHDLRPGGRVTYFMTSPEGEKYAGYWDVQAVDAPRSLELKDGFADEGFNPNFEMPTTSTRVTFEDQPGGTRMVMTSTFPSVEDMEKLIEMGMDEGIKAAMGQMDAILAGP
jgi:uncharacterized protein YndB with AHSA1/START domain